MEDKDKEQLITGTITEALPNATFRVDIGDGKIALVYLSGKMRLHRIKVLVGDTVSLIMDEYGERGRIVKRF